MQRLLKRNILPLQETQFQVNIENQSEIEDKKTEASRKPNHEETKNIYLNNFYFPNIEKTTEIINAYKSLSLEDAQRVKLMNRSDTKFVTHASKIAVLLEKAIQQYYIMEINNKRLLAYRTKYFDTHDFGMYYEHHRGKLNRYKIRQREYINDDTAFLEVKFKTNKRKILKKRIPTFYDKSIYKKENSDFIKQVSPYSIYNLEPKIENFFKRLTLVHCVRQERITIDFGVTFNSNGKIITIPDLAIIELKRNKDTHECDFRKYLKDNRISPSGMSKYCTGIAMLENEIKKNNFKQKLKRLEKISSIKNILIP